MQRPINPKERDFKFAKIRFIGTLSKKDDYLFA